MAVLKKNGRELARIELQKATYALFSSGHILAKVRLPNRWGPWRRQARVKPLQELRLVRRGERPSQTHLRYREAIKVPVNQQVINMAVYHFKAYVASWQPWAGKIVHQSENWEVIECFLS